MQNKLNAGASISLEQAINGLTYIDSSDRETWVKIAFALKDEYGELAEDAFLDWSATAPNFCTKAALATWKSAKQGSVKIGSLIHIAKQGGWQFSRPEPLPPHVLAARKAEQAKATAERLRLEQEDRAKAAKEAATRFNPASPANPNHPYLIAKMISPYDLKQEGNGLLIPIYCNKQLINLQVIYPNGQKLFIKGGQVKGGYSIIGNAGAMADDFYLVEGWATGASLHEATSKPVLVAFNAGNLLSVAIEARKAFPYAQIVIGADNDLDHKSGVNVGVVKAQEAALAIRGQVSIPPIAGDWNDYLAGRKREALAKGGANHG